MGLFRRKESLNERLLREGGMDPEQALGETATAPEPESAFASEDPSPLPTGRIPLSPWGIIPDVDSGTGEWDTATTATAPGISGDHVEFITLPNGDVIVEKEKGDGDLSPLADAIERHLSRPYRATASRQNGDLWGVGAKGIEVAQFPFAAGNSIELAENDGAQEFTVDGEATDAIVPVALQRLGEAASTDFCVEATRIDGDFWEVKVSPL